MPPKTILAPGNGLQGVDCQHRGLLVPTVFRRVNIQDPAKPEGSLMEVFVTVQAVCMGCQMPIRFGMPGEVK